MSVAATRWVVPVEADATMVVAPMIQPSLTIPARAIATRGPRSRMR